MNYEEARRKRLYELMVETLESGIVKRPHIDFSSLSGCIITHMCCYVKGIPSYESAIFYTLGRQYLVERGILFDEFRLYVHYALDTGLISEDFNWLLEVEQGQFEGYLLEDSLDDLLNDYDPVWENKEHYKTPTRTIESSIMVNRNNFLQWIKANGIPEDIFLES